MSEWQQIFERQTSWQKKLGALSWPEKVRLVEKIKDSIQQLKAAPCLEETCKPFTPNCDQDAS